MKDLKDKITKGVWEKIKIETADYKDIVIGSDIKKEVLFRAYLPEYKITEQIEANIDLAVLAGNLAQKYDPSTWEQKLSQFEKMEKALKEIEVLRNNYQVKEGDYVISIHDLDPILTNALNQ